MTEIAFYHLTATSGDQALPRLLEKSLQSGYRCVVRVADEQEATRINDWLWSYAPESFLPHGTEGDGHAEKQPVLITPGNINANNANLLVVVSGAVIEETKGFDRILDIFDGSDDQQLQAARTRWKDYSARENCAVTYFRQTSAGSWEKQAA